MIGTESQFTQRLQRVNNTILQTKPSVLRFWHFKTYKQQKQPPPLPKKKNLKTKNAHNDNKRKNKKKISFQRERKEEKITKWNSVCVKKVLKTKTVFN